MGRFFRHLFSVSAIFLAALAAGRANEIFAESSMPTEAELLLERALDAEKLGNFSKARRSYRKLIRKFPTGTEAPMAMERMGSILLEQRRFQPAFQYFQNLLDRYPEYPRYIGIVGLEFQIAERMMRGQRNYFWGKIPGFKNRTGAIEFFRRVVERAPYGDYAPEALLNIAHLGIRTGEPTISIEALEKLIDGYGNSPQAPDALLLLARIHRDLVPGPDYDQRSANDALNYYQEFLILFPDSPRVDEAEAGLKEVMELRAAGKLSIGNFYYDGRQNPEGAKIYYAETLKIAPENSAAAECARRRLAEIAAEKPGKGTPLDHILGPYKPSATDRFAPSSEMELL
ncbi:MAG: tetratricopeptide repeat protein [Puniceicoccales bacterium]|nr:tetratricopeptide repeat protein [Puniceicoccales bacterium]